MKQAFYWQRLQKMIFDQFKPACQVMLLLLTEKNFPL
jgi:hypothetical protein